MNGLKKQLFIDTPNTIISSKENHLIFNNKNGVVDVPIDDIDCVYIKSKTSSITINAINCCLENNVLILTMDDKHNPYSQFVRLYGGASLGKSIHAQIKWADKRKELLTKLILINKFEMQNACLSLSNKKALPVNSDSYNDNPLLLEGNVARLYFFYLFGNKFTRDKDIPINHKLNYGYSIVVSYINRIIIKHGYITNVGIHHSSKDNNFNLTYDLFEPFRPFIDLYVHNTINDEFDYKYKKEMAKLLDSKIFSFTE